MCPLERSRPAPGFFSTTRASNWEECLIAGNGRVGALVYGDPVNEIVTLSHERLFLPLTAPMPPIQMATVLDEVRALLLASRFEEAATLPVRLADGAGYGGFRWTDPFVPAFDLHIAQRSLGAVRDYRRGVHFDTGVVDISWSDDRGSFSRDLFVSRPDDVVVTRVVGATPGSVDCTVALSPTLPPPGTPAEAAYRAGIRDLVVGREGTMLTIGARFAHRWGHSVAGYRAVARVEAHGGRVRAEPDGVAVSGADSVVVLVLLEMLTDRVAPALPSWARGSLLSTRTTRCSSSVMGKSMPSCLVGRASTCEAPPAPRRAASIGSPALGRQQSPRSSRWSSTPAAMRSSRASASCPRTSRACGPELMRHRGPVTTP